MKKTLMLGLVLLIAAILCGQQSNWHVYRPGGFSGKLCYRNNELWIASGAGILRWNPVTGQKTQYDPGNAPTAILSVYSIITAQNGDIWAAGYHGVLRYNGLSWDYFDSSNSPLPSTEVFKVIQDNSGAIWVGCGTGVYKYFEGNWTAFTSQNSELPQAQQIYGMAVDNNNRVWLATGYGVWNYFANIWVHYTSSNSSLPNATFTSIAFEADGTGWFGNYDGVAKYVNGVWQQYTSLNGNAISQVRNIYIDAWQRVWFACQDNLICRDGVSYQNYPRTLFSNYTAWFNEIIVDSAQNIWLGFYDTYAPESLVKFDGVNQTRYPICELPLPSSYVQSIFKGFDDKLWLGTAYSDGIGGYISIDGSTIETFGMYNTDMPCDHVWSLAQDPQLNMWVGTCIGLLRTGPSGSLLYNSNETGVGTAHVNTICPVAEDEIWIGTNNGVSRYANGSWSVLTPTETGLNLATTKVIKQDSSGRVWIGCSAGVACLSEGQWTAYPELSGATDIAFGTDGTVWVARGQISYLQNGVWNHYDTTNSGLVANHVCSVAVDNFNVLWAGSQSPNYSLYRLESGVWRAYNSSNSVITGMIKTIFVDENNTKWIGSSNLILFNENGIPSGTEDLLIPTPSLVSSYPNPFREDTRICYEKMTTGTASLSIFNLKGQKVWEYTDFSPAKGKKEISWNGKDKQGRACAAGVYLIKVDEKGQSRFGKAVRL